MKTCRRCSPIFAACSLVHSSRPSINNNNLSSSRALSTSGHNDSSSQLFSHFLSRSPKEESLRGDSEMILVHRANGTHTGRYCPHASATAVNRGDSCNRSTAKNLRRELLPLPGPPRIT